MNNYFAVSLDMLQEENHLSFNAKILLSYIQSLHKASKKNSWVDNGKIFVHCTIKFIVKMFQISDKTAIKLLAELEHNGYITRKKQGLGKPDKIFLETKENSKIETECSSVSNDEEKITVQEEKKVQSRTCKNYMSRHEESTANNKIINNKTDNKTDININHHSKNIILKNLIDDEYQNVKEIEAMKSIQNICQNKRYIKINNELVHVNQVLNKLKKLSKEDIKYAFRCISKNIKKVKNIEMYMLTTLYNINIKSDRLFFEPAYLDREYNYDEIEKYLLAK